MSQRRHHPSINKQPRSIALRAACIAVLVFLANHAKGQNVSVAYSFLGNDAGGVAQVEIEPRSGKIVRQRFLFKSRECEKPAKVRRSLDNRYLALTNLQKKGPHLFLFTLPLAKTKPASFSLPSIPDELRFAKGQLLVSCEEDALGVVSLTTKPSLRLIRFDDILTPLGNGPQDIHVVPDSDLVVISCQKDGKTGKTFGNRLVLLQLPKLDVVADLQLPRDHPELHFVDNNKESGPGPEIVYVSAASDTLVATLDLYGGVGIMKWSAAREGRIENWSETSTSLTQSWGTAFPDRASALRFGNREYFLVHNAGSEGGSSVVDLQNRKVIWQRPTPPGMEQSVYFPSLRQAFSVCSGKVKERSYDAVEKILQPQTSLYVFDFRSQQAVKEAPIGIIPLDSYTARIHAASNTPPLLLIAVGASPDRSDTLITFDPVSRTIKDSQAALGRVSQFER